MSTANSRNAAARLVAQHEAAVKKPPPASRGEGGRFASRGSGAQKINDRLRRAMGQVVETEGPGAPPAGSRARPLPGGGARQTSGGPAPTAAEISADIVRQIRRGR